MILRPVRSPTEPRLSDTDEFMNSIDAVLEALTQLEGRMLCSLILLVSGDTNLSDTEILKRISLPFSNNDTRRHYQTAFTITTSDQVAK